MELSVDLIESLAVIGVASWLFYKFLSPPSHPIPRGPEKMCEPWWKSYRL